MFSFKKMYVNIFSLFLIKKLFNKTTNTHAGEGMRTGRDGEGEREREKDE